jgi:hypothetical protein
VKVGSPRARVEEVNMGWRKAVLIAGLGLATAAGTLSFAEDNPRPIRVLAQEKLTAARKGYEITLELLMAPPPVSKPSRFSDDVERICVWSRRWTDAEFEASEKKVDRYAARAAHFERMKKLEGILKELQGGKAFNISALEVTMVEYYRLEAELLMAKAKP